jgi:hypothetical protein
MSFINDIIDTLEELWDDLVQWFGGKLRWLAERVWAWAKSIWSWIQRQTEVLWMIVKRGVVSIFREKDIYEDLKKISERIHGQAQKARAFDEILDRNKAQKKKMIVNTKAELLEAQQAEELILKIDPR